MLVLETTAKYRKDFKLMHKRGLDLKGNYIGFRECHIEPNWLLIYTIDNNRLILTASRTGTHSDLFKK